MSQAHFDERPSIWDGLERRSALRLTERVLRKYPELVGVQFKIADTKEEFEGSFRLVHDVYAGMGLIDSRKSGLYMIPHHLHPGMRIFVVTLNSEVISTVTLVPDGLIGLPQDELYGLELQHLRDAGRKLAELSCLAMHPKWQKHDLILYLYKVMHHYAYHSGIDDLCVVANPKHGRFYERVLLFEQYGQLKPFSKVNGAPALGYRLNLRTMEKKYRERYSQRGIDANLHDFFFTSWDKAGSSPRGGRPLSEDECVEFFAQRESIIPSLPQEVLESLTRGQYQLGQSIDFLSIARRECRSPGPLTA